MGKLAAVANRIIDPRRGSLRPGEIEILSGTRQVGRTVVQEKTTRPLSGAV
jgi:hypothetical protein